MIFRRASRVQRGRMVFAVLEMLVGIKENTSMAGK